MAGLKWLVTRDGKPRLGQTEKEDGNRNGFWKMKSRPAQVNIALQYKWIWFQIIILGSEDTDSECDPTSATDDGAEQEEEQMDRVNQPRRFLSKEEFREIFGNQPRLFWPWWLKSPTTLSYLLFDCRKGPYNFALRPNIIFLLLPIQL